MSMRTSRETVVFDRPFSSSGIDQVQPAGTHVAEADVNVDPLELEGAQERDLANVQRHCLGDEPPTAAQNGRQR